MGSPAETPGFLILEISVAAEAIGAIRAVEGTATSSSWRGLSD